MRFVSESTPSQNPGDGNEKDVGDNWINGKDDSDVGKKCEPPSRSSSDTDYCNGVNYQ